MALSWQKHFSVKTVICLVWHQLQEMLHLLKHWLFWLPPKRALKGMPTLYLVRACRNEGEAVRELPAASPASGSSENLLSWPSLQGIWDYSPSMDGMLLSYRMAINSIKGQGGFNDTLQTPERIIKWPASFPLPAFLNHLQSVFKSLNLTCKF